MSYELEPLGWDSAFMDAFESYAADGLVPGRVAVQHRGAYDVYTELGELRVDLAGRLSHEATGAGDLPAVGDWVAVAARPGESAGTIQAVLPRRTKFSRARSPGARRRSRCFAPISTSSSSSCR